jgi:predicted Zn-dependent protease
MRFRMSFAGSAVCLLGLAFPASSQMSSANSPTSQVSKTWEVGRSRADQLDLLVQRIESKERVLEREYYFAELNYLQQTEDRIAAAAGVKPQEIRVTGGSEWYASLLPQGVLYISVGLLDRVSSEAELLGLLAHELGHQSNPNSTVGPFQQCALGVRYLPVQRNPRESERRATQRAICYMKSARYDPLALLDLLSQISYENQRWSKSVVAEDLLSFRVALEAEAEPLDGYVTDDSKFAKFRARLSLTQIPLIIIRPH